MQVAFLSLSVRRWVLTHGKSIKPPSHCQCIESGTARPKLERLRYSARGTVRPSLDPGGLSSLILNIQALSKNYATPLPPIFFLSFFTCTQLVSAMSCFHYVDLHVCISVCVWSLVFLVTVVLIAAICVVKANKYEPWKLNDEISKQTKMHTGLLHSQLLCIYMGKTPAPRVCGGPFRGQYYNTVN